MAGVAGMLSILLLPAAPAKANELRLDYENIAALIVLLVPRWRAHQVDASVGSHGDGRHHVDVEAGTARSPVLAVRMSLPQVRALGGVYSAMPLAGIDGDLTAVGVPGGVHIELKSTAADIVVDLSCRSGFCPPDGALPEVVWKSPSLAADVVATAAAGITIRKIAIGGNFAVSCARSWFPLAMLCEALAPTVASSVAALAADPDELSRQAAGASRPNFSARLKIGALRAGEAGVRVSFCFQPDCH